MIHDIFNTKPNIKKPKARMFYQQALIDLAKYTHEHEKPELIKKIAIVVSILFVSLATISTAMALATFLIISYNSTIISISPFAAYLFSEFSKTGLILPIFFISFAGLCGMLLISTAIIARIALYSNSKNLSSFKKLLIKAYDLFYEGKIKESYIEIRMFLKTKTIKKRPQTNKGNIIYFRNVKEGTFKRRPQIEKSRTICRGGYVLQIPNTNKDTFKRRPQIEKSRISKPYIIYLHSILSLKYLIDCSKTYTPIDHIELAKLNNNFITPFNKDLEETKQIKSSFSKLLKAVKKHNVNFKTPLYVRSISIHNKSEIISCIELNILPNNNHKDFKSFTYKISNNLYVKIILRHSKIYRIGEKKVTP